MNKVTGIPDFIQALNDKVLAIKEANIRAFIKCIILIRTDMGKNPPKIPIDLGNLNASFFSVTAAGAGNMGGDFIGSQSEELAANHAAIIAEAEEVINQNKNIAVLGFSANYAWWVHEMVGANFSRDGSGAKFFEASLLRNAKTCIEIIAEEAKMII